MEFEQFVRQHGRELVRFARGLVDTPVTADDLVQESLARAWLRWQRIGMMTNPVAYVQRIIATQYINMKRLRSSTETLGRVAFESSYEDQYYDDQLHHALELLPPRQRIAVVLRYLLDMSESQAATVMKCSQGTIKSQLHKALVNLRSTPNLNVALEERSWER